jgi:phospholipid/cholesterol/gamma-HCH transport system ATP-binding protein
MDEAPIIQVRSLTAGYGDTVLFRDIHFDVHRGEIFVILGASGCGKSTLLKQLIGLETPRTGSILIQGDDIVTATRAKRLNLLRRMGVMYQNGALFGSLSLHENVLLPLEEFTAFTPEQRSTIALLKLALVGLEKSARQLPAEISGGMQKRAAIARAMALDPAILFLDEPSAGLDPVTSAGLDNLIRKLARNLGITFVVVTHELPSIFAIADRVIMLDKKTQSIIATGSPADLRDHSENPDVRAFFNRQENAEEAPQT